MEQHSAVTSGSIRGNAHISTIDGSRGLVCRLFRWRPGSPWSGADRSPAAGFMSGQSPGREAERFADAKIVADDAVRILPLS